jgi:PAS domain S-box-containing protein
MGDALAHLVITPAILYWFFGARWKLPSRQRRLEAGLLTLGLIISEYLVLNGKWTPTTFAEPQFFLPVPFLFWAAIRFGMFGASGAIIAITILSVDAALAGHGPFFGQSPGNTAWILQNFLMVRAVPLYLVAILIEQRKGIEDSLRESEDRFRNMANTAPVLIWVSGPDQLGQFFNQGWLDYTGRTPQQELGTGWTENLHIDDRQHCLEVYASSFDARKSFEMECRLRRRDGGHRYFLLKGVPRYAPNGDFLGFIGSAIDIHDRKWAEEANRHLAHVQRLAMMGEFTAMISHEVNQPLGAIMSNAEAAEMLLEAREKIPLNELRQILADIRKDDLRANKTIDRIRALSRNQSLHMEPLDLNETVSDVFRLIEKDARRWHIDMRREFSRDLPFAIGDRVQLQQVLLNLIVNGIDAMKDTPEPARLLTVGTKHNNGNVEVIVTDCGCGISPEQLPRIFESFYTTKHEGTGLGLSIARSIIEAHKGQMWAENNAGRGAAFHFTIQAARKRSTQ